MTLLNNHPAFQHSENMAFRVRGDNDSYFNKELAIVLKLEVEGKKGEIFPTNLEDIDLELHTYGYEARVHFSTFDGDEFDALFGKEKKIDATLTFKSTNPEKANQPLIEFKGIVYKRAYKGISSWEQKGKVRLYEIHFTDPVRASWSSHYPVRLFVDQTMKEVLDAEKNPLISIQYDWEALNAKHPIIAYSLALKAGQDPVNFYSFLHWYLHKEGGILEYNYKENSYKIVGKKSEPAGKPLEIGEWLINAPACFYPEPSRFSERSLKHSTDNLDNQDSNNPNAFQSVRKDIFDDSSYRSFPEQLTQKTKSQLFPEKPEVIFMVKDFSDTFNLDHIVPGALFEFKGDKKLGRTWSADTPFKDKKFRIKKLILRMRKTTRSEGSKKAIQPFWVDVRITAEDKEEAYIPRPVFHAPVYPFSLLGKVFCEIGDKEQTTFNLVKDEKNPITQYQVIVPLAGKDKKVIVPFTPDFTSGQSYFPFCKDQEVMLSVYFQTAKIERVVGWQPLVLLPPEEQACQIVFGSNGKDKYFFQKHEFKDGKDSIFIMKQSSSSDQTQIVQIKEKEITVTVEEKGKSTLLIQLNRDSGLTFRLQDEAGGVTQETVYNPTSITQTSKGSAGTSTIVQKPDSIEMKSKKCSIQCEELNIAAEKTIAGKADSKISIEAPVVAIKDTVKVG